MVLENTGEHHYSKSVCKESWLHFSKNGLTIKCNGVGKHGGTSLQFIAISDVSYSTLGSLTGMILEVDSQNN